MATALLFFTAIIVLLALSIVLGSFFTVETAQVAIVQRLGKFARVAGPGPELEDAVSGDRGSPAEHEGAAVRRAGGNEDAGQRLRADTRFDPVQSDPGRRWKPRFTNCPTR